MSLYRQQALHQAEMGDILADIFDFLAQSDELRLGSVTVTEARERFLRAIGETLDFEPEYTEKAVNGELTEDDFNLDNQVFR